MRSLLGAVVAVGLVSLGIVALQQLVPVDRDSPVVVGSPTPAPRPTATPPPTTGTTPASAPATTMAARPPLTVLNNSRVSQLAAKAAADFSRGGWQVVSTGNLRGRIPEPTVYFAPGQQAAAAALRAQFPAITRALPRYAGLPGSGLTVVVTRDYPH